VPAQLHAFNAPLPAAIQVPLLYSVSMLVNMFLSKQNKKKIGGKKRNKKRNENTSKRSSRSHTRFATAFPYPEQIGIKIGVFFF
jgi:hypothetical protein